MTPPQRAPLDGDTRHAYDSRVRTFLAWLDESGSDGYPLTDSHDRDFAVRAIDQLMDELAADAEDAIGHLPTDQ